MVEEQEDNYTCKTCQKIYTNRGSLAVHMRIHAGKNSSSKQAAKEEDESKKDLEGVVDQHGSLTGQEKMKKSSSGLVFGEGGQNDDCGLREKPNNSGRTSDSRHGITGEATSSKESGQGLPSSTEEVAGTSGKCGKGIDLTEPLSGHIESSRNPDEYATNFSEWPVKRKRSRVRHNAAAPNPSAPSGLVVSDEVKEGALSLLMMSGVLRESKKVGSSISGFLKIHENKSIAVDRRGSVSSDESIAKSPEADVAETLETLKYTFRASLQEGHVSMRRTPNMMNVGVLYDNEAISVLESDDIQAGQESAEASKGKDSQCPICFRAFPSARDLRSHKKIHHIGPTEIRKEKRLADDTDGLYDTKLDYVDIQTGQANAGASISKKYPCSICFKELFSPQALVAHKRLLHNCKSTQRNKGKAVVDMQKPDDEGSSDGSEFKL